MPEIGTHHQPEWHFLKSRREISRCLDADSELTGLGPAFQADGFPSDAGSLVDADLGLSQSALCGFAMFPLRANSMDFWLSGIDNRTCHRFTCRLLLANKLIRPDHHHFCGIIEMIRFVRVDGQVLDKLEFKT